MPAQKTNQKTDQHQPKLAGNATVPHDKENQMAAHFTIAGVEITQGLQYYHSKDHLVEPLDQGADNSLPLIANKRTWVRVYLECDSGYTANVSGSVTVSHKIGENGEWSKFGTLSESATCKPVVTGTKSYHAIRSSLSSSLNFDLPPDWIAGELRIDIQATDGVQVLTKSVSTAAKLRQTLKIAGIMVEGNLGGTKIAAPNLNGLEKTAWKAPRLLPVSDGLQFRVVTTITMTEKLDSEDAPGSWATLHDRAIKARDDDGNKPGWVYYVLIPPLLVVTGKSAVTGNIRAVGMEWGDGLTAGREMVVDEGYDAIVHEIGHASGLAHAPFGNAPAPDPSFPLYQPYDIGSIGEYGLDVVDGTVISPLQAKDIMGYGGYTGTAADNYVLWISPFTYRKLYNNARLNPEPAESPTEIWRGRWTTGWTRTVPFELGGKPHLFSYKAGDGKVDFDRIRGDGKGTTNLFSGKWKTGWTNTVAFQLGGKPHLCSYKAGDGKVDFDRIRDDGKGTTNLFSGTWTTGWTNIVEFQLGGKPHLCSYKAGDGKIDFDRIRDDGKGTTNLFSGKWTTGWTNIVAFELGGKPHLFSYKADDGTVDFDRIRDDGKGTTNLFSGKWTTGWTNIVAFQLGGKPYLFSYKAGDGRVDLDRIRDDGKGTTNLFSGKWTTGWTNIIAFLLGGKPYLFSYKAGDGTVTFDRVNA